MDIITILISIAGGFLAGIINTLAGNGSAITLSILTELIGLPGNLANGTNRVGILFQCAASSYGFAKNGQYGQIPKSKWYILSATIGALVGVTIALNISNEQFKSLFKYLLLVMLVVILVNPKRWLIKKTRVNQQRRSLVLFGFFLLGIYGGFIQMGMGVLFLILTVLAMKINMIHANALKVLIIALYTTVVLGLFAWRGLVEWQIGLTLAFGQTLGGLLTAQFASQYEGAEKWAYRILVLVVMVSIISAFT